MLKRRSIVLAAVCMSLASPAAAKPITWVNGAPFKRSGPPPGRTAFILDGPIDASAFQSDFVHAFDGDSSAGQTYFTTVLKECLTGARLLGDPPHGIIRDQRHRLDWRPLPETDAAESGRWVITWTGSATIASPVRNGADSLSAALARMGSDWLIVIDDLVANLEPGEPGETTFTPEGEMRTEGGKLPVATLTARVLVVGAHPPVIAGSGHVSGWRNIGRFRKSSVDGIAESFVLALERALGKW